jgi:general secretion pathway protein I
MKHSFGLLRPAGFTLVETLVAMVIMTGGIIVLANAWSGNFSRVKTSRINTNIATLLERKMTEYEIKYKDKPLEQITEEASGDFGSKYPGYAWTMTSKPFEMPDMSGALVAREGGADEMLLTITRTMTEFIKQSAKEVTVSVTFKGRKGQELKHTVTALFVDYSKDIQLPGALPAGNSPQTGPGN